jgi:anti-sigma B factor antagonist
MNTASTDPVRPPIIDLEGVAFFGSSGLNAVLGCLNDGRANGIAVLSLDEALQVRDPETQ